MRKILQTVFCVLACLCVVAAFLLGAFFGFLYCLYALAGAAVFAFLMVAAKNGSPRSREISKADFMNSDEENKEIRKSTERDTDNIR